MVNTDCIAQLPTVKVTGRTEPKATQTNDRWESIRDIRKGDMSTVHDAIASDLSNAGNPDVYRVLPGDTLWDVAEALLKNNRENYSQNKAKDLEQIIESDNPCIENPWKMAPGTDINLRKAYKALGQTKPTVKEPQPQPQPQVQQAPPPVYTEQAPPPIVQQAPPVVEPQAYPQDEGEERVIIEDQQSYRQNPGYGEDDEVIIYLNPQARQRYYPLEVYQEEVIIYQAPVYQQVPMPRHPRYIAPPVIMDPYCDQDYGYSDYPGYRNSYGTSFGLSSSDWNSGSGFNMSIGSDPYRGDYMGLDFFNGW